MSQERATCYSFTFSEKLKVMEWLQIFSKREICIFMSSLSNEYARARVVYLPTSYHWLDPNISLY